MDNHTLAAVIALSKKYAGEITSDISADIAQNVTDWLDEHVDPETGYVIDDTLTIQGAAADAKATGDAVTELKNDLTQIEEEIADIDPGLSDAAKVALLNCFQHVAWIDEHGQTYYDALESALYADSYPKITAQFNSGLNVIYTDDTLDSLKQYLTVKYYETEEDAGTVIASSNYSLSGMLTEGASTVFVSYSELTTSFVINGVVDFYNIWEWDSESTGVNALYKLLTSCVERTIEGAKRGFLYASQWISNNNRRSFCVNRGKQGIIDWDGNPTSFYPVPVPKTATKLTANITPSTQQFAAYLMKYEGQVRSDGYNYLWYAPSQISWHTGVDVVEFNASENLFVSFNCRKNVSNDQYAEGEEPTMHILFE